MASRWLTEWLILGVGDSARSVWGNIYNRQTEGDLAVRGFPGEFLEDTTQTATVYLASGNTQVGECLMEGTTAWVITEVAPDDNLWRSGFLCQLQLDVAGGTD